MIVWFYIAMYFVSGDQVSIAGCVIVVSSL